MTNLERLAKKVGERHPKAEMVPVAAASGLVREAAEYFHLADSWAHDGKAYNEGDALMELSDVLHYLMEACRDHGVSIRDVAHVNVLKMEARDKGEGRAFEQVMHGYAGEDLSEILDEFEAAVAVVSR